MPFTKSHTSSTLQRSTPSKDGQSWSPQEIPAVILPVEGGKLATGDGTEEGLTPVGEVLGGEKVTFSSNFFSPSGNRFFTSKLRPRSVLGLFVPTDDDRSKGEEGASAGLFTAPLK